MSSLSIIIPCYNEETRLPVDSITQFLHITKNAQIIFVNDGSTDNTPCILKGICEKYPERCRIITHERKKGKAEAVRSGLLASIKDSLYTHHGFLDADLSISPGELFRLFGILSATEKKFILGSRIKKIGARIVRNEWRHFYSRIIATIVGSIIKLNVYDTQCSAKIFQAGIVREIFADPFHTKWLFDVEVICRIHNKYGDLNLAGSEEPVLEWVEKRGSKLRWYHFFNIVNEVFILQRKYKNKK